MKKLTVRTFAAALALALLCSASAALGESQYVSIKDIRDTIPQRWTGEYTTQKGETVSIDTPIVVPQVDTVPIVRITWGGPYEGMNEALEIRENNVNFTDYNLAPPEMEFDYSSYFHNTTLGQRLTWEEASGAFLAALQRDVPALKDRSFECYCQSVIPSKDQTEGLYLFDYYVVYHGIPYLIGQNFRLEVESEHLEKMPSVPYNHVYGTMLDSGHYFAAIGSPAETGVDFADVPLLPFSEILKVFQSLAEKGYIYSLDEMRLGYMAFIDPDKKGEEFVLMPVWVAKGRTTGDPAIPVDLRTDQEVLDYNGYHSLSVLAVNAQSGKFYEFTYDTSPDRRYVPKIITWDDVK